MTYTKEEKELILKIYLSEGQKDFTRTREIYFQQKGHCFSTYLLREVLIEAGIPFKQHGGYRRGINLEQLLITHTSCKGDFNLMLEKLKISSSRLGELCRRHNLEVKNAPKKSLGNEDKYYSRFGIPENSGRKTRATKNKD